MNAFLVIQKHIIILLYNRPLAHMRSPVFSKTGLGNLGNTCFMNTGLQMLLHVPELRFLFSLKSADAVEEIFADLCSCQFAIHRNLESAENAQKNINQLKAKEEELCKINYDENNNYIHNQQTNTFENIEIGDDFNFTVFADDIFEENRKVAFNCKVKDSESYNTFINCIRLNLGDEINSDAKDTIVKGHIDFDNNVWNIIIKKERNKSKEKQDVQECQDTSRRSDSIEKPNESDFEGDKNAYILQKLPESNSYFLRKKFNSECKAFKPTDCVEESKKSEDNVEKGPTNHINTLECDSHELKLKPSQSKNSGPINSNYRIFLHKDCIASLYQYKHFYEHFLHKKNTSSHAFSELLQEISTDTQFKNSNTGSHKRFDDFSIDLQNCSKKCINRAHMYLKAHLQSFCSDQSLLKNCNNLHAIKSASFTNDPETKKIKSTETTFEKNSESISTISKANNNHIDCRDIEICPLWLLNVSKITLFQNIDSEKTLFNAEEKSVKYTPRSFHTKMSVFLKKFDDYRQHDCGEFISAILDAFHEDFKVKNSRKNVHNYVDESQNKALTEKFIRNTETASNTSHSEAKYLELDQKTAKSVCGHTNELNLSIIVHSPTNINEQDGNMCSLRVTIGNSDIGAQFYSKDDFKDKKISNDFLNFQNDFHIKISHNGDFIDVNTEILEKHKNDSDFSDPNDEHKNTVKKSSIILKIPRNSIKNECGLSTAILSSIMSSALLSLKEFSEKPLCSHLYHNKTQSRHSNKDTLTNTNITGKNPFDNTSNDSNHISEKNAFCKLFTIKNILETYHKNLQETLNFTKTSKNDSTPITELFFGAFRSSRECLNCSALTTKHEPFLNLSLPIPTFKKCNVHVVYKNKIHRIANLRNSMTIKALKNVVLNKIRDIVLCEFQNTWIQQIKKFVENKSVFNDEKAFKYQNNGSEYNKIDLKFVVLDINESKVCRPLDSHLIQMYSNLVVYVFANNHKESVYLGVGKSPVRFSCFSDSDVVSGILLENLDIIHI